MTEKVRGLKKLASLYGQVEQIRSLQARAAAAEVAEAAKAMGHEAAAHQQQLDDGRAALRNGDREGWIVAAAQAEIAEARQRRLEPLKAEREAVYRHAAVAHQASRQSMEQIDGIVETALARETEKDARRVQTAADDRYLSRRMWMQNRSKTKE